MKKKMCWTKWTEQVMNMNMKLGKKCFIFWDIPHLKIVNTSYHLCCKRRTHETILCPQAWAPMIERILKSKVFKRYERTSILMCAQIALIRMHYLIYRSVGGSCLTSDKICNEVINSHISTLRMDFRIRACMENSLWSLFRPLTARDYNLTMPPEISLLFCRQWKTLLWFRFPRCHCFTL